MKKSKLLLSLVALLVCTMTFAQRDIPESNEVLFDDNGSFTRVVNTPVEVSSKIIKINPLLDDVPWRKTVLRVIDLREQQNRALYYPYEDLEPESQKNLFSIIFSNVLDGNLQGFKSTTNPMQTYVPKFDEENLFNVQDFIDANGLEFYETTYDKVNLITPGVIKYYIQEVWYFNKSTSTFHNKIIAIAPLYDKKYGTEDVETGVFFWIPYENLRPFLQEEFIKVSGRNVAPLVNFDDFFITRQFYSYIVKDYDIVGRDVDTNIEDPDYIKQEQNRIEDEIMNFELDLWNY